MMFGCLNFINICVSVWKLFWLAKMGLNIFFTATFVPLQTPSYTTPELPTPTLKHKKIKKITNEKKK